MGRTKLSKERAVEVERQKIGKIIVFCEGMTEKNYLDYFAEIINKSKYTDVRIETETANGNSKTVINFADRFLSDESNSRKYVYYNKYVVFDCDDPPNIQNVIDEVVSSDNGYSLLVSNFVFEIWLLMHFEDVDIQMSKQKIYDKLSSHLEKEYKKADSGIIREIINNGNIEAAIRNARELEKKYELEGKTILSNIATMNPYTNVYSLIEQFMVEIS